MDKKYVIFDMDGTLVDSMGYWDNLTREYLEVCGVNNCSQEDIEKSYEMKRKDAAKYLSGLYGINKSAEDILTEITFLMKYHYSKDVKLKRGVREYLEYLKQNNVRMCIASASTTELIEACLRAQDIAEEFDFTLSCEEIGARKNKPDIYLEAAKRFGAKPQEIAVFEDVILAANTAKEAGFYTVGVYDESSESDWEAIKETADLTIEDWERFAH